MRRLRQTARACTCCAGVLFLCGWAAWSPAAPAPPPRAPRLAGTWALTWGGAKVRVHMARGEDPRSGAWRCDWLDGHTWAGTWRQEVREDGSSTLTVSESLPWLTGDCTWQAVLDPGKRRGKTVPWHSQTAPSRFALEEWVQP
jgi:hypothetical protein